MTLRPLVVNTEVLERIHMVKDYAKAHVMSLYEMMSMMNKPEEAVGNNVNYRVEFPIGYRVIYSLEQQGVGLCHHLSISVDEVTPTKDEKLILPSPVAVNAIIQAFGIKRMFEEDALKVWIEPIEDGGGGAINVLMKVKEGE